jgi:hypothetical protein
MGKVSVGRLVESGAMKFGKILKWSLYLNLIIMYYFTSN